MSPAAASRRDDAGSASDLVIDQVTVRYDRVADEPFTALADVDLDVPAGRFVALVGRSGCGKSTLLRTVAGFVPPTLGSVLHGGRPVLGPSPARGYVFQADAVFPWLTVRGNIEFGLKSRGVARGRRRSIAQRWCEVVGLADFADAYPKELSGGMRKRVDLARVYANEPDVLLLDEPFGALDAQTKEHMQTELLRIWEGSGKTVLFVTHDVDEAVFLADEVLVMATDPGRIAERFVVDLPRARTEATRVSDEFARIRRAVRQTMQVLEETAAPQH